MSKKTNSLLYRFGISTLWKNKSVNKKSISNIVKLESVVFKELKKNRLKVSLIKYEENVINISVYNSVNRTKNLKYLIKKYFSKVLCFQKVMEKFGLNFQFICQFLVGTKIRRIKSKYFSFSFNFFWLFFCKYFIFLFLHKEKFYKSIVFNKIVWLLKNLSNLHNKVIFFKKIFNNNNNYEVKLRKTCGLLKIKLLSIYLENIVFKYSNFFFDVWISHIFLQKGIVIDSKVVKKYKKQKQVLHTILLGSFYMNTSIISDYLSFLLVSTKNHKKILKIFLDIFEKLFFSNIIKLKGFQLRIAGKLGGKMRKSKYNYKLGKVQLRSLNFCLNYSLGLSYTKFGVISVKVWLLNDSY